MFSHFLPEEHLPDACKSARVLQPQQYHPKPNLFVLRLWDLFSGLVDPSPDTHPLPGGSSPDLTCVEGTVLPYTTGDCRAAFELPRFFEVAMF